MVGATTPDGIKKWETGDAASLIQMSTEMADSIQTALNKRERFDFVWANSAERSAQTGMVQGSRGYQIDTESDYIFDNSVWQLATAHSEYTFSGTTISSGGTPDPVGTLTLDSGQSTSTTQTSTSTSPASGQVIIVNPGIYAYSVVLGVDGPTAMTGRAFIEASFSSTTSDAASIISRVSVAVGEDRGSLGIPNLRITVTNTPIFCRFHHVNGGDEFVTGRIRITRLG